MARVREVLSSVIVEPPLLIYLLCMYYLIPAQNSLILYKVCLTVKKYDRSLCDQLVAAKFNVSQSAENEVSAESSKWMFYGVILFVIPSVIVTTIMGKYVDRKGHKLPLLLPFVAMVMANGYQLCMAKFSTVHVGFMLISSFIHGLGGGFSTVTMAGYSYLTSFSTERYRTVRMTVLEGCMSFGSLIGSSTLGIVLDNETDPYIGWRNTYISIISLGAIAILFILLQAHRIGLQPVGDDTPLDAFKSSINPKETFSVMCHNFPSVLHLVLAASFTFWVTGLGESDVLYSFFQRMQMNRTYYGYFDGLSDGLQALGGILIVYVVKRRFYWQDTTVALLGIASGLLSYVILGISGFLMPGSVALFWSSPVAGMFAIVADPSLRSIASHLVSPDDQGKLLSFITAMDALLQLLTSGIYQYLLWPHTEEKFPSACLFLSASCTTFSIFITCRIRCLLKRERQQSEHRELIEEDIST